jgi:hypothetical protein
VALTGQQTEGAILVLAPHSQRFPHLVAAVVVVRLVAAQVELVALVVVRLGRAVLNLVELAQLGKVLQVVMETQMRQPIAHLVAVVVRVQ